MYYQQTYNTTCTVMYHTYTCTVTNIYLLAVCVLYSRSQKKLYVQNFNYCKSTVESTVAKKCGAVKVWLRE